LGVTRRRVWLRDWPPPGALLAVLFIVESHPVVDLTFPNVYRRSV
jgi:hypothetical protein